MDVRHVEGSTQERWLENSWSAGCLHDENNEHRIVNVRVVPEQLHYPPYCFETLFRIIFFQLSLTIIQQLRCSRAVRSAKKYLGTKVTFFPLSLPTSSSHSTSPPQFHKLRGTVDFGTSTKTSLCLEESQMLTLLSAAGKDKADNFIHNNRIHLLPMNIMFAFVSFLASMPNQGSYTMVSQSRYYSSLYLVSLAPLGNPPPSKPSFNQTIR